MQFKTLALAAIAVAAVNAQSFAKNECSTCVFSSFSKDASCSTLTPEQTTSLNAGFEGGNINPLLISKAIQDPVIKTCVCHWTTTAFTSDAKGAAGACFAPATPAPPCNASQVVEATTGIKSLETILNCAAAPAPAPSSGVKPSTTGSAPSPTAKGDSGAVQMNIPYVLSFAALGLAALAGL
ncbi:hypothetical protein FBU30_006693 [Linnemannia zychae]|nr:hypothetical protein FBU30_006693 [Linnemannia zychae]